MKAYAQNKDEQSISGQLLMLDDTTPHMACVVQAVRPPDVGCHETQVVATTLSDERGRYVFDDLSPGMYQVRCITSRGDVYYKNEEVLHVAQGQKYHNIDFRIAPFKKGNWNSYTTREGFVHNSANQIYADWDGTLWFSSDGNGMAQYDGEQFSVFSPAEYRRSRHASEGTVWPIYRDPDGIMWIGTWRAGLWRYDGHQAVSIPTADGSDIDRIFRLCRDVVGRLWIATAGDGVYRYNGEALVNFTTEDGLPHNVVWSVHSDPDGIMWFGTGALRVGGEGGGLARYDGHEFTTFTTRDGLPSNTIFAIHQGLDGIIWLGTNGGVSRYDGHQFINFTTADGLVDNRI